MVVAIADGPVARRADRRGGGDLGAEAIVGAWNRRRPASLVLVAAASRGRRWAGPLAILLMAATWASRTPGSSGRCPIGVRSQVAGSRARSERAEAKSPSRGPFRVARLAEWHPIRWIRTRSPDRLREIVAWERDTLQSGHGMLDGLSYTLTPGVLEPEAYVDLFQPWTVELDDACLADVGPSTGTEDPLFPEAGLRPLGFAVLHAPGGARRLARPQPRDRGVPAEYRTDRCPPRIPEEAKAWREDEDWQLLRNPSAMPRAWVVHDVNYRKPIEPGTDESRALKKSLLHQADPFWTIPDRPVEDPRRTAWVEVDDPKSVGLKGDGSPPSASEIVTVTAIGRVKSSCPRLSNAMA